MTFSFLFGAEPACLKPGLNSLAFVSLGRGLIPSANIFSARGFLSFFFFLVEIWCLDSEFCSACYYLHCKFQRETFSITFNLTWCSGTCQELGISYGFSQVGSKEHGRIPTEVEGSVVPLGFCSPRGRGNFSP